MRTQTAATPYIQSKHIPLFVFAVTLQTTALSLCHSIPHQMRLTNTEQNQVAVTVTTVCHCSAEHSARSVNA